MVIKHDEVGFVWWFGDYGILTLHLCDNNSITEFIRDPVEEPP